MSIEVFEIERDPDFKKRVDRFLLKKKFRHLPEQIKELAEKLQKGEFEGDKLTHRELPTPHDIYKIRLPNPDTGAGKSNGYRIIYMVVIETKIVIFLTIYYKKEDETVSDNYINGLIDGYFINLPGIEF